MLEGSDGNKQNSPSENGADPILIIEVPFNSFADPALEIVGGLPAEFLFYFGGVDGVAAIVAGTIFDERDEFAGVSTELGFELVDKIADEFHDPNVGPFVVAPDVVGLPCPSVLENLPKSFGMIANVEPVANVHSVAVEGNRFTGEQVLNDDRNELFGELVGTVVVGAIGDNRVEPIGVMISADEHVARGFAGRVRRVRSVWSCFGEIAGGAKAAIDFVSGDM